MPHLFRRLACASAVAAALAAAAPAHALVFTLTTTGNAAADAGFARAAAYWEGVFVDPITVNITAGFANLGCTANGCVLGSASSQYFGTTFAATKAALAADATSADDATMVAGLPGGSSYSRYLNNTTTNAADHVQSGITTMRMTRANAKAVGLLGASGLEDAAISFSNQFAWDFDPTDGIGAGLLDFVGVAIHELGHAMGFTSGVDVLDTNGTAKFSDTEFAPFTTLLDFTRCSQASEAAGADIDWRVGTAAKDFAIDGACTALVSDAWSTGRIFGDGEQASHWKDGRNIGIMDPTAQPRGVVNVVTATDIQALDVVGWTTAGVVNPAPEPSSLLLVGAALLALRGVRRGRKAA